MDQFRQNIVWLRNKVNLSQEKFGKLFDLTRGQIESYEKRNTEISIRDAEKICKYFRISLDQFFNSKIDDSDFGTAEPADASQSLQVLISDLKRDKEDLRERNIELKERNSELKEKNNELKTKIKDLELQIVALTNKLPANPLPKGRKISHS